MPTTPDEAVKKIEAAKTGDSVAIGLGSDATLDRTVLQAARGKDITLECNMGTYAWLIDGKSITDSMKDVNLTVTPDTSNVPATLVEQARQGKYSRTLSLSHNGEFGFTGVLKWSVGTDYAGKAATLYYYNPDTGTLEATPENSGGNAPKVTADGYVMLSFTHASDYVLVVEAAAPAAPENPATPNNAVVQPPDSAGAAQGTVTVGTGDDLNDMWLYAAILLVCAVTVGVTAYWRKRTK